MPLALESKAILDIFLSEITRPNNKKLTITGLLSLEKRSLSLLFEVKSSEEMTSKGSEMARKITLLEKQLADMELLYRRKKARPSKG